MILKNKNLITILITTGLLSGCIAANSPKVAINYLGKQIDSNNLQNGQTSTARVGETILARSEYTEVEALNLTASVPYGLNYFPSGYYTKIGSDEKYDFFNRFAMNESEIAINQQENSRTYVRAIAVDKQDNKKICPISVISGMHCFDAIFKIEKTKSENQDSFEQVLIYNGNNGSKINIGYREFSNDRARPAFSNDVEYDLSKSKEISYKGASVEVIEANNKFITFRVISIFRD